MAKQTGIHGLRGKVNGMSYYSSKNGGKLVRTINEGLGARVKTSKEYLNTRKNNAEFGACGDFAGAFIGSISSRWRFILNSIATGMMVKAAKAAIAQDSASPWGGREIVSGQFPVLRSVFNTLSKNAMPECIASGIHASVKHDNTAEKTFTESEVLVDTELASYLREIGANGFMVDLYHYEIVMPAYDADLNAYSKATGKLTYLSNLSADTENPDDGDTILSDGRNMTDESYSSADNEFFHSLFVLFRPYRTIGGEKSILQQHCAGAVYVPENGTIE